MWRVYAYKNGILIMLSRLKVRFIFVVKSFGPRDSSVSLRPDKIVGIKLSHPTVKLNKSYFTVWVTLVQNLPLGVHIIVKNTIIGSVAVGAKPPDHIACKWDPFCFWIYFKYFREAS